MSLCANNYFYESGLNWVNACRKDPHRCLEAVWRVGQLAWQHHPGRFADGALENPVFRLGLAGWDSSLPANIPKLCSNGSRSSKTLHVATVVYPTGGHTRAVAKWALRDVQTTAGVVLTQQDVPLPEFFGQMIAQAHGEVACLPLAEPMATRAALLREIAKHFDRVVLHTHPQDPIPVMAFSAGGGPPVAMYNHAHFSFCLGSSVSDVIVNTMDYFKRVTEKFRFPRRVTVLTGTPGIAPFVASRVDKEDAKRKLGFDASAPVVMSIGAEIYYQPMEGYDFFQTSSKLLKAHPSVHLLIVGPRPDSLVVPDGLRSEKRFHCVGPVVDPSPYYRAADVCLESFPMPSLGALVEAVMFGEAFPVPVYGVGECILRVSQAPVLSYSYRPRDEEDYLAYVAGVLQTLPEKREEARRLRLTMARFDQETSQRLDELNHLIDGAKHTPVEIPKTELSDCFDCRILARLASANLERVSNYLPYHRAVPLQLIAAARGLIPPRRVAVQIVRRPWAALIRRLPGKSKKS